MRARGTPAAHPQGPGDYVLATYATDVEGPKALVSGSVVRQGRGMSSVTLPAALVGDGLGVPCVDGTERPYLSFDASASTSALPQVMEAVQAFVPWYAGVHHGAGYKSQASALAYASVHRSALAFAGRGGDSGDVAVMCRNTTEAINHLAYRLRLGRGNVVVTTVTEHYSNLLPWVRAATCRFVECGRDGTFGPDDVTAALDQRPVPRLLAITGASNVTGWLPPSPAWTK